MRAQKGPSRVLEALAEERRQRRGAEPNPSFARVQVHGNGNPSKANGQGIDAAARREQVVFQAGGSSAQPGTSRGKQRGKKAASLPL